MQSGKKGDWVQITQIVFEAGSRAPQVPEDTQKVPLQLWVKGYLQADSAIGETVTIITITGRNVTGVLTKVNPGFSHNYGDFVPELQRVGGELRSIVFEGDSE
ncbi:MAG: 2-amino-4-ketopentanoate thiolase [Ignavibacteria bacterium]|nr:2-amino-4-ketopentanoate thiolase [Ignavibacteria bacterium]